LLSQGANPQLELHVRIFLRRVFLDDCSSESDKALWLNLVLKPFAMVDQARVLFLLFGPISNGKTSKTAVTDIKLFLTQELTSTHDTCIKLDVPFLFMNLFCFQFGDSSL